MYRSKYFKYMNVYYSNGKKVGFIKDILVDFNEERIIGFCVSSYKILNKNNIVLVEDIISINKNMVVKKLERGKYLSFNDIKHLEVIDIEGVLMGVIEDIIINEGNFRIVAIIISMGFLNNFIKGKKIISPNEIILGETNLLYFNYRSRNLDFKIMVKNKMNT
ncbi:PRC-barrel domain-containing protein [Clostridium botulinum]|uniref:PRC-barrel domain-containing protein n=1 Tax=Clostridium botulinum TaxID=1491 RepID=UPI0007E288AA|nr:PRC-barrel domain-containing protein [Clostridium botulinum]KEI79341.1 photosystem reaction center subunit H [Clostridium botulinum A2 117]KEI85413.1 photosystem reaction center subunit H [Clostridium botulinum B2 275]KEI95893.1 photosystem reaction center subunit H [Clostridium botulinum F 357]MBE1305555.1 photosystem reaction center subunit H [Clostridium botulinum]MBN3416405.1 photosystem reaction center subunit H [Clostridium botulinum]